MAELKLVISDPKTGKSYQKVVKDADAKPFFGKKIGQSIKGELINMTGYEFEITGGSDYCGMPMRRDIEGAVRRKILSTATIGLKTKDKWMRKRKRVAGNTFHPKSAQVNLKIIKYGKAPLEEKKEESSAESASAEKKEEPKEDKKGSAPQEEKNPAGEAPQAKEEKKEDKPKEEAK
ncbi:30S ribosomal protein S6e [Candidatus Woesearchaeota archaeon]|nr:MAG: 30S ribosomal protein S6e [Candidatus Woesearchaeota archaeon]